MSETAQTQEKPKGQAKKQTPRTRIRRADDRHIQELLEKVENAPMAVEEFERTMKERLDETVQAVKTTANDTFSRFQEELKHMATQTKTPETNITEAVAAGTREGMEEAAAEAPKGFLRSIGRGVSKTYKVVGPTNRKEFQELAIGFGLGFFVGGRVATSDWIEEVDVLEVPA